MGCGRLFIIALLCFPHSLSAGKAEGKRRTAGQWIDACGLSKKTAARWMDPMSYTGPLQQVRLAVLPACMRAALAAFTCGPVQASVRLLSTTCSHILTTDHVHASR